MSNFPFQRLQSELAVLIAEASSGERLPSEPALAKQLGVSRATLREAMRTFETQGLIRRRQGAGTFVVGRVEVLESGLEVLESLDTMARRLNLKVTVSDLAIERVAADQDIMEVFGTTATEPLTRIQRVIRADTRPVAFLMDILPESVLAESQLPYDFSGSVLDFLLARGDTLTFSRAEISATNATSEVARRLEVQRGDVLLQFRSQLFGTDGQVVDYSISYFIPGYFNFHVVRRVGTMIAA